MDTQTRWRRFGDEQEPPEAAKPKETLPIQADGPAIRPGRVRVLLALLLVFIVAALIRMIAWQVIGVKHTNTSAFASTDPARGRIVDSHGLLMATDTFIWDIWASPRDYRNDKQEPDLPQIAALLGVPAETLTAALAQPGVSALVAKNVSEAQCDAADHGEKVPVWVWCDFKRQRVYPIGALGVHILGLTDGARIGRSGVEGSYDSWLLAASDADLSQLPGLSTQLPGEWKNFLPSPNGHDLVLHLDAGLQYLVEKRLTEAIAEYEATGGTIIVMDPHTGAILALANWPNYDPNDREQITNVQGTDASVSVPYEPGSVFKIITYAAALDTGLITPDSTFYDSGSLELSQRIIQNAEEGIYGTLTAREALANSVNTICAEISLKLGPDSFYRYVRQFGFGRPTEVDLANEVPGTVKRPGTEEWSQFEQATNSFGQGISVTPIQLTRAAAAIANGGVLVQPQVVHGLVNNGMVHALPTRSMGRAIKPETANTLTQMMVYTVENYTAGPDLVPGYRVAGKTGTAEIPEQGGYTSDLTITTFAGFLPAADPKLVILVKLVEPRSSRWAEQVALPTFGGVARDAVQVLGIPPDDRMP